LKVLFISGSVGLGHVTRDVAMVKKMREIDPEIEFSWLAEEPALSYISSAGEKVLPASDRLSHAISYSPIQTNTLTMWPSGSCSTKTDVQ